MKPEIAYQVPGFYTQDQWFFCKDEYIFFYHLLMPLEAGDAGRWGRETIGVSRSRDLRSWEYLGIALAPSQEQSAWDSKNLATGSIVEHGGRYWMFYCGGSLDKNSIPGIGLAVSDDLVNWERYSDVPVYRMDSRWYSEAPQADEEFAAADPYVFFHDEDNCFYMLITAVTKNGVPGQRGCVALARSVNLIDWEAMPPLIKTQYGSRPEVPQVWMHGGRWYLMFSMHGGIRTQQFNNEYPEVAQSAAYVLTADSFHGPYNFSGKWWVLPNTGCYTAKVIPDTSGIPGFDGRHALMSWQSECVEGEGCVRAGATVPFTVQYLDEGGFTVFSV
jgi:beta-fructofuranosidase